MGSSMMWQNDNCKKERITKENGKEARILLK
jgi:hypothetical protein